MASDEQKLGPKIENPPEVIAPSEPKETSLPDIAAKADDLAEIKKAVEDAAAVSGGLWLSYLFVLFYIAIAAGAVTHEDLLLIRPVKLPFLNVELPLKAFFALAPFIVLIIHAYALMHFIMLGKKASRFHNELRRQFPSEGANKEIRDKLRRLLPSNIFVQILAGPPELRTGVFGAMLKLIALTTLVVFPILVLLLLQIQFLPFHDVAITWAQRAALLLDILVLWLLRPPILADLSAESFGRARVLVRVLRGFGLGLAAVMSIAALWLSVVVATIPTEWQETALASLDLPRWQTTHEEVVYSSLVQRQQVEMTKLVSIHDLLFAGDVDRITRRRKSLFSNTLVLPGFNVVEALKVDDPKKLDWKQFFLDLRGRHLEQAVLDNANLTKVDLMGAQLQGAWLRAAILPQASLDDAQLQGARLDVAYFAGASLRRVQLQGASLALAGLESVTLEAANLQGAWLRAAKLQGAKFAGAQLQGASLDTANLQGASFEIAQLQGASLIRANLRGAWLDRAWLQGASLGYAQLQGASLQKAQLQGASLDGVTINATDFRGADLWRTNWGKIDPAIPGPMRLELATWKPIWQPITSLSDSDPTPWDSTAYAKLRDSMNGIPEGNLRDDALKRIERLDCGNFDETLASCDPAAPPTREVLDWQKKLSSVDDEAFAKVLATELRGLVCASDASAIHILHGVGLEPFEETGPEAPALIDFIMSKDCPVSAALTGDDKAKLLKIKQDAEEKFVPPPTAKKEK